MKAPLLRLLKVAIYGILNARAKWQCISDNPFQSLRLIKAVFIPELFYQKYKRNLVFVVANTVEEFRINEEREE